MHTKMAEHGIDNLHELHLVEQRVGTNNVAIKLPELTITAFLRTVCSPYGLHLVALKGQLQFVTMHHHIAGKGYGKVIAETLLTEFCCEMEGISLLQLLVGDFTEEVA